MIKKLRKKMIVYSLLGIFVFLAIILSAVNITNFALITNDADRVTDIIRNNKGYINGNGEQPLEPKEGPGHFDPGSKSNKDSIRYFTYSIDPETSEPVEVVYAMDETFKDRALSMATSLGKRKSGTGWIDTFYRFRTYKVANEEGIKIRYVTVIDQERELRPAYYVLFASLGASLLGLGIAVGAAIFISKKLVQPIEEVNNKQQRFIADAALALRTPASVISIDNATLVKDGGGEEKDANKSIRKQVDKLIGLADNLNSLALFEKIEPNKTQMNLSNITKEIISRYSFAFKDNKKELVVDIQDNISYFGDVSMIKKMLSEILDNALKFANSTAKVALNTQNDRIVLLVSNDSEGIPEGSLDTVFNKFSRLDYKDHSSYDGSGVGLSIVKEIVDHHNGRAVARGENGFFILKIEF